MKKRQMITAAVLALALGVFGAAGFFLVKGITRYKDKEKKLDEAKKSLAGYFKRDPFPSAENVAKEVANKKVLEEWLKKLLGELIAGQVEQAEKSPSIFVDILGKCKDEMIAAAARATNTVVLPVDFALGFDRYFGRSAPLPAPDDVPRLTQQLIIVTNLCTMMYESRVKEVLSVWRENFETVSESAARGSVGRPAARPAVRPAGGAASSSRATSGGLVPPSPNVDAGQVLPGQLFGKMTFMLDVRCGEKALLDLLNRLASSQMFIAVTGVEIDKENDEIAVVRARMTEKAAASGAKDEPVAVPAISERMMTGPAMEVPMKARIELDVYRFQGL